MIMYKAFKYRIYPTIEQENYFSNVFGCVRFIYNKMLSDKIDYYKNTGLMLHNTPAQYKSDFPWLKNVDSLALANAQLNLQKAYSNFFKYKNKGFPKFKSKKKNADKYTTYNCKNNIRISEDNKYICIPKIKLIKINYHRQLPDKGLIKSVTISKTKSGKYYISILCEYEHKVPTLKIILENSIGLDYSSHDFYVDNFGNRANYPRFYRLAQNKLAREQRKLSKMKLHSNNFEKQKIKVARLYEKVSNCRLDFLHKLSTQIANKYEAVFVEDINMQGMSQSLHLGKSTLDNSFGVFRNLLAYKFADRGKIFHKINKFAPSSQICSNCGRKHSFTKDLSVREWTCPDCGMHHDRDINAAKNIREIGIVELS